LSIDPAGLGFETKSISPESEKAGLSFESKKLKP
jgi:hypothetical protein